jgi:putative ABC transport system ATP-binding protein
MSSAESIVSLVGVSKQYGERDRTVWALRDVTLEVHPGEFLAVMGPSGSGKSTLLNLIAGLDVPSAGEVQVDGQRISDLSDGALARMRRRTIAYVFQFFNLLPTLSAAQNVSVPLRADGRPRSEVQRRVEHALEAVGLTARAEHYPDQLSGGEMQRVAIARALATDARVILADEPTGNLDTARSEEILDLLRRAAERDHRAIILVTHDVRAAACGDRLITLRDGQIVDEVVAKPNPSVMPLRHVQH